ncbi:hypothetical protein [Planococcus sp. YIM B11945]|uniref:hypothetical protein n=1 Tax=Planococcus sp. YIM B11945 TaxID=3435410 RepID=UPI003D7D3EAE
MRKNKIGIWAALLIAAVLLVLFFMPRDNEPSPSTRVVMDHSVRTYIAPSCFQEADATNFLEDGTLQIARDLDYAPHSECTEKAFKGNRDSMFVNLLKELGIMEKESKDW